MERNSSDDRQPFIWHQLCTAAFPNHVGTRYSGKKSEIPKAMLEVTKEDVSLEERDCTNIVMDGLPGIIRCGL
jgi:hypothetical protein